jgi:3'(2'), 5'-bisphosphate nucleotidase
MTPENELEIVRAIALEAATLVKGYWRRPLSVETKVGDEPVTEADRAASALIVARLAAAFPTDAILSEELPDDGSRLTARRTWMVDPIDGTRDFIDGDVGFAVMIGVVSQPATGVTYGGVVGGPAWREGPEGVRAPLRTSALAGPPGIRLVASKSHRTPDIDAFRRRLAIEDELNVGGVGLKVGLVAEAARDLYVYPGKRTKIWDTCAPEAILLAAGGRLTDIEGQPLRYTDPDQHNRRGLIASNGPLHDLVLRTIAEGRRGDGP